jgi:hypothetical protein
MSDTPPPAPTPPPLPLPPRLPPPQSGCVTALMVVIGIILLLPGVCSLFLIFGGLVKTASDVQFVAGLLMVGALGVALLWWASQASRS